MSANLFVKQSKKKLNCHFKMSELEIFLLNSNILWHSSIFLKSKYGRDSLNNLFIEKKIEIRNGINCKVIRYLK